MHMVPWHLVPHNWSPIDWSLWTNSSQPIRSPWTNGLQKFGPHGQMVPKNLIPMDKWSLTNLVPLYNWSLEYSVCPRGQAVGIQKFGDQTGWGPFVLGDQFFWNHLSMGTEFDGDRLSRGINFMGITCSGGQEVEEPEVGWSNGFGTKCVTANMKYMIKKLKVSCRKMNSCPIAKCNQFRKKDRKTQLVRDYPYTGGPQIARFQLARSPI